MSTGAKIPYATALASAETLLAALEPYCTRLLIAGSLRRQRPEVGDLELVVSRRVEPEIDMFGEPTGRLIDLLAEGLRALGITEFRKSGERFKQFSWSEMPVDLFIATPATWGCVSTIRTGSSDFSKWLVTDKRHGGACPAMYKFSDGRIWQGTTAMETAEERQVFELLELDWVEPVDRLDGRWRR
jgi:DNA polymerase/3'-5' exonuclease PolX